MNLCIQLLDPNTGVRTPPMSGSISALQDQLILARDKFVIDSRPDDCDVDFSDEEVDAFDEFQSGLVLVLTEGDGESQRISQKAVISISQFLTIKEQ